MSGNAPLKNMPIMLAVLLLKKSAKIMLVLSKLCYYYASTIDKGLPLSDCETFMYYNTSV